MRDFGWCWSISILVYGRIPRDLAEGGCPPSFQDMVWRNIYRTVQETSIFHGKDHGFLEIVLTANPLKFKMISVISMICLRCPTTWCLKVGPLLAATNGVVVASDSMLSGLLAHPTSAGGIRLRPASSNRRLWGAENLGSSIFNTQRCEEWLLKVASFKPVSRELFSAYGSKRFYSGWFLRYVALRLVWIIGFYGILRLAPPKKRLPKGAVLPPEYFPVFHPIEATLMMMTMMMDDGWLMIDDW